MGIERASLDVGGTTFEVVSVRGEERLSTPFRFEVVCSADSQSPSSRALIGQVAVVTLRDAFGNERNIQGIVAEASRAARDDATVEHRFVVRPPLWDLGLARSCRAFHDVTVIDIAEKVLAGHGVPFRRKIVESHPQHSYRVEYREDDLSFISRLFEEEGVYFWFDHEDGSKLVLSDHSVSAPDLAGGAAIDFVRESGMTQGRELIDELGGAGTAGPTKFSIGSFDPQKPLLKVAGETGTGIEAYDAPGGGPRSPQAAAQRATLLREATRAAGSGMVGRSSSVRLAPGRVFEVHGHPSHDGRYLVVESITDVVQRRRNTGVGQAGSPSPFACRFRAIPQPVPFRPPVETPVPRQAGLQSGAVVGAAGQEVFPDEQGRVRVQLHWDREGARDEKAGWWMRVAQRGTAGSMLLPRMGWNVMTHNEEGSVDAPSLIARVFDAEHPPPYALPGNETRVVFKTATIPGDGTHNELHFEDKKGAEVMFLNASRDMFVLVNNDKTEDVIKDARRTVALNHDLGVTQHLARSIKLDQKVTIGSREKLTVVADRSRTVGQNERETVGGNRSLHTGQNHTTTVKKTRKLKVGVALIDATLGPIDASAGKTVNILVGAAAVRVSAKTVSEEAMLASIQTIGGARLEMAKKTVGVAVKGTHIETVGGAMILKSGDTFSHTAETCNAYTVGAAMIMAAPEIIVQAGAQIQVVCGASSILIEDGKVEIHGATMVMDGASLVVNPATRVDANA